MAEILETLGNNSELSKALYEIFGHIATSAILKANEKDKIAGSSRKDGKLVACKSVPLTKNDVIRSEIKQTVCDDVENGTPCTSNKKTDTVVDSSLGRPRYQWRDSEADLQGPQRTNLDPKQLFSVYVGHLPTDITQGELEDLFEDIGEVVDSYVFPSTNGHSYTYGFVRFYTLEEAKDAVKEKHLKVIGNNQINVELSSTTRRKLQDDPEDEGSSPLLRKEYPKGPRKTLSDNDEKQVIDKMKASLRRLNSKSMSSFGNYSAEETFENIKTVLKLLINYPMTLADPSADRDEDKSSNGSTDFESKHQTSSPDIQPREMFLADVTNQQQSVPHCQTTSRLPNFALGTVNTTDVYFEKPLASCVPVIEHNDPPASERKNSSLVTKVREFLDSSSGEDSVQPSRSERWESNVPDSKQSLSESSTEDERHIRRKNALESKDINVDSRDQYPTNYQPVRSLPVVSKPCEYGQNRNSNEFFVQHYKQKLGSSDDTSQSVDERTLVETNSNQYMQESHSDNSYNCSISTRTLHNVESSTRTDCIKSHGSFVYHRGIPDPSVELPNSFQKSSVNETKRSAAVEKQEFGSQRIDVIHGCSTSDNAVLKNAKVSHHSSFTVNAVSECIPQYNDSSGRSLRNSCSLNDASNSLPSGSSDITSRASGAWRLSPNSTCDTKLPGIQGKNTLFQGSKDEKTQMNDTYTNLNQTDLVSRSYSLFPLPSSTLNTSLEQKEFSLNSGVARLAENSDSQISTILPCFNDVLYPISNGDKPSTQLYSQELQTTVHPSVSTNRALLDHNVPFSLFHDSPQHHVERKVSDQRAIDDSSPNETTTFYKGHEPSSSKNVVKSPSDKRGSQYSKPNIQSREAFSTAHEDTALSVNGPSLAQKVEVDSQAKNPDFSPCVQRLFDSVRRENCRSNAETRPQISNENGLKSPGRRSLAPSFSFSASQNDNKEKGPTKTNLTHGGARQNKESFISTFSAKKTTDFQSSQTTNDMINNSAILSISNTSWKTMSNASKFDFGFDGTDTSESTLVESSESEKKLQNSFNPTHDRETVKLKEHLEEHVLKLEEMQRILNSYPQHRRKKQPLVFEDPSRSLELETRIHDAEILLQKKEEMSRARSNERELAYEKELFHSSDDNPLLVEFAREIRKESLRSEIFITELKYKILELKIEQYQRKETAQM